MGSCLPRARTQEMMKPLDFNKSCLLLSPQAVESPETGFCVLYPVHSLQGGDSMESSMFPMLPEEATWSIGWVPPDSPAGGEKNIGKSGAPSMSLSVIL